MLEMIMLILPGVIATLFHCKINNIKDWKKAAPCTLPYIIFINLIIYIGLWKIGMKGFNIFEMSLRFKVKWLALGLALAAFLVIVFNNIININRKTLISIVKRLLPASILLIVSYAIFAPSLLFLENISEFQFSYIRLIPILLCVALILWAAINFAAFFLTNEKTVLYYNALIFSVSLCIYIQRNFLNSNLPSLDGTEIDWTAYTSEGMINAIFWVACILVCLIASYYFKEKAEKVIKYFSYFLCAVQMLSLMIMVFTVRLPEYTNYGFTKENEFALGSEDNIVIFIVDTLQAALIEEYITSDFYPEGNLDDFTFFNNGVSGASSTHIAVPLLLTGVEYDPIQPIEEYHREKWDEVNLYDRLHEQGYDIRFFSKTNYISNLPEGIADNYEITVKPRISDKPAFGKQLYKLVNLYLMPQFIKSRFWTSTDSIINTVDYSSQSYNTANTTFYQDMQNSEFSFTYEKTFRLYHINGVHRPYTTNERLEELEDPDARTSEMSQFLGVMMALYEYIDEMKRLGVYDSSTIIITGDHGRHEDNNPESNPAILIKQPYEQHELAHDSAPINFRNIVATIAKHFMDDYSVYGPCVNDITVNSDVERLHTIDSFIRNRNYVDDEWDESYEYCRLIVPNELDELFELDKYQVWNPYNINRISYILGENIDFTTNNDYANDISYRLYKENNSAVASSELSICFDLKDYNKKNLEFHFKYSKIYNSKQNIRIYANGSKIETVTCTEENAGTDQFITIPKNKISDNKLIIRMVFPNAVTPNQLDRSNPDTRILSVAFDSMLLE